MARDFLASLSSKARRWECDMIPNLWTTGTRSTGISRNKATFLLLNFSPTFPVPSVHNKFLLNIYFRSHCWLYKGENSDLVKCHYSQAAILLFSRCPSNSCNACLESWDVPDLLVRRASVCATRLFARPPVRSLSNFQRKRTKRAKKTRLRSKMVVERKESVFMWRHIFFNYKFQIFLTF